MSKALIIFTSEQGKKHNWHFGDSVVVMRHDSLLTCPRHLLHLSRGSMTVELVPLESRDMI